MTTTHLSVRQRKWAKPMVWMIFFLPLIINACNSNPNHDSINQQEIEKQIAHLANEGKKARENNEFDQAINYHTEELLLAEQISDSIAMAKALNNIATNYRRLGILDQAAANHYRALDITMHAPHSNDSIVKKTRVIALNGLGNIYLTLGDLHTADSIFRIALAGERDIDSKLGQAINLANIGRIKKQLGQIDSAWIYFRYSLALNRQVKSKLGESLCLSHFAGLHELEGHYSDAIDEYKNAINVMADSPDDWHKLNAMLELARLYIGQGKRQDAQQLLSQAKSTAEKIHSLEHRSRVHQLLYELYDSAGNHKAALDHYRLSTLLKDSLADSRKTDQIENMRVSLESQRQKGMLDQANERYLSERMALRITTVVLVVFVLVALTVIATLWYTIHQRSKTQRIVKQMNKSKEDFFANIALDPTEIPTASTIVSEHDRQFIGHFVDVVYSQMAKGKTDVESVAEQMGLNRAQLNRRIMSITGQNTLAYISQIRMSKAKRLLRADLTTPIGDIAIKCGFDDVAYFSRLFKQQTNMTPSQYRKMI